MSETNILIRKICSNICSKYQYLSYSQYIYIYMYGCRSRGTRRPTVFFPRKPRRPTFRRSTYRCDLGAPGAMTHSVNITIDLECDPHSSEESGTHNDNERVVTTCGGVAKKNTCCSRVASCHQHPKMNEPLKFLEPWWFCWTTPESDIEVLRNLHKNWVELSQNQNPTGAQTNKHTIVINTKEQL